ncbi:MAG: response regulator [Labilithrix sp.]|nr:response regulator [Labilithrix sp.]
MTTPSRPGGLPSGVGELPKAVAESVSNILVVDDEPANLVALEATLEPLGQNVVRATSGREALRHALKADFALVLMDVQMPEMDGFEVAALMRGRARTRDVPIIFLTAISKDSKYISRGYDVGAVDYLFKPYEPDMLRAKVAVFVDLARKRAIIRAQHEALRTMSARELAEVKRRSDQRYADLADSMPQLVWTTDAEGRLHYGNRRWEDFVGMRAADFSARLHPDDVARFRLGWEAALARGEEWEAELRLGGVDEGYRVHLVRTTPRYDEQGQITSWVGTSTDIDARVRAERSFRVLADASRRLATVLEDPVEIEAVLRDALPVLGDVAALEIAPTGSEPERIRCAREGAPTQLFDDPRFDLGPSTVAYSGRPEIHLDVGGELAETRSPRTADHASLLHELGVSAYMCLPLLSRGRALGTITLARTEPRSTYVADDVVVAEDLARRIAIAIDNAHLHEMTERRRVELEQANRSKDVFLATLSHELRTPLNAIVGWTDMMKNGQLGGGELGHAIETIDRNALALSRLVADLLDVSRIVTGTLNLESSLVGLASVVESAIEAARPQCTAKHIGLDMSLDRVGCVRGDAVRLRQVIGNLLSNAIKFTPSGGRIVVRVAKDESGDGEIVVEDSGEGIAAELLPHVFERFRQAENAKTRGLGLGLAIVKHLVELHGGTASAASEGTAKGARFTVRLPLEAGATPEHDGANRSSWPPIGGHELGGVHALVVEDDPDGNELITTILERYGARVTSVVTAAAALDVLEAERPDIVVSDIGLPDLDGMELIKSIRARPIVRKIPAIALTAYASRQDAAKAIAAGFDAHVAKPVQPGMLGSVVGRLLARAPSSVRSAQPGA